MSWSPCFSRSVSAGGRVQVRLGHETVDGYLESLAARCRPNTVLAAGFDLRVFFSSLPKDPVEVTTADVLAFITEQRSAGDSKVTQRTPHRHSMARRDSAAHIRQARKHPHHPGRYRARPPQPELHAKQPRLEGVLDDAHHPVHGLGDQQQHCADAGKGGKELHRQPMRNIFDWGAKRAAIPRTISAMNRAASAGIAISIAPIIIRPMSSRATSPSPPASEMVPVTGTASKLSTQPRCDETVSAKNKEQGKRHQIEYPAEDGDPDRW